MVVPYAYNILDRPVVISINGKKMTSNSNQIMICVYPSRKTEKLCAKNQSSKKKENQVIEQMGN
jgi:hypothetical protein